MDDAVSVSSHDNDRSSDVTSPHSPPSMVKMAGSRGWLESERRYMQRRLDQLEERERRLEEETRETRNYLCTVCSALCESTSDLQRHLSKHVTDLKEPESQTEPRVCRICSLEFISRMALNVHRNSPRHKEREMRIRSLFHCDHCGHYFANRDAYAMHMLDVTRESAAVIGQNGAGKKSIHLGLVVGEVDTLSFLQSLAGKSQTNSSTSSPVQILKVKEEPRDEGYGDVGKNGVTSSTEDPVQEVERNNGVASGRKSREPLDLSHIKNERPTLALMDGHVCGVCSQIFDSRDSLAMHAMEHCKEDVEPANTGGVPLTMASCHICGHRALSLVALNVHMLMHARPVDLSIDPKNSLAQLGYGDLVSEIVQQNSMNSFTCKICDLEFQNFASVVRHCSRVMHIVRVEQLLRKSFGATSLQCTDCNKKFERDCDFRIHKSLLCTARRSPLQSPEPEQSVCSEPALRKRPCLCPNDPEAKRCRSSSSDTGLAPSTSNGAPLQTPLQDRSCLCPNDSQPKRLRSSSSDTGLLPVPSTSRKDSLHTPLQDRPSSSRPLSVDSGRSASPDHEALANRQQILSYLENQDLQMCTYCKIIYTDRTVYYLHMGLHNHNNPWQCNLCGRVCANVHEFSSHVIHYS